MTQRCKSRTLSVVFVESQELKAVAPNGPILLTVTNTWNTLDMKSHCSKGTRQVKWSQSCVFWELFMKSTAPVISDHVSFGRLSHWRWKNDTPGAKQTFQTQQLEVPSCFDCRAQKFKCFITCHWPCTVNWLFTSWFNKNHIIGHFLNHQGTAFRVLYSHWGNLQDF